MSTLEAMLLMAKAFNHLSDGKGVDAPLRLTLKSPNFTTLFMPTRSEFDGGTSIKVGAVPNSGENGLPATTLVMDEQTGGVKAVVNARSLTALRTAAGTTITSLT